MTPLTGDRKRVVIVGGGIAGLTTALTVLDEAAHDQRAIDCTVIEAQSHWGGKIVTGHHADRIIEGGPDSFLTTKSGGLNLCKRLGLTSELINTNQANSQTFAYSRGRLREFPQGLVSMVPTQLGPLFQSGLVTWSGILRMAGDWCIPARRLDAPEETLAGFFTRRLGTEAFQRLIEPLVAGIYAGDAAELSVEATFPQFVELERDYGGLIKGALAQQRARRSAPKRPVSGRTLFTTLKGGLGDLIAKLLGELTQQGARLLLGTQVTTMCGSTRDQKQHEYRLTLEHGDVLLADAVVLATPAYATAHLMRDIDQKVSVGLEQIPYASTMTISLVFPTEQVQHCLKGFGFVVPRIEQQMLIAATWSSMKWAGRVRPGESLIRCYLGGRGRGHVMEWEDDRLIRQSLEALRNMVGIDSKPIHAEVYRWNRGMPQYTLGHRNRVNSIRRHIALHPGLYVTGAAYEGIGIPDCIRDGQHTAQSLVSYLWKNDSKAGERDT